MSPKKQPKQPAKTPPTKTATPATPVVLDVDVVETPTQTKKRQAKEELEAAERKRNASNFVTSMGKSNHPEATAILEHYKGLGRYDEEKTNIIALWNKDRSLKWVNSFVETRTETANVTESAALGHGTK